MKNSAPRLSVLMFSAILGRNDSLGTWNLFRRNARTPVGVRVLWNATPPKIESLDGDRCQEQRIESNIPCLHGSSTPLRNEFRAPPAWLRLGRAQSTGEAHAFTTLARRACFWAALVVLAAFAFWPQPDQAAVTEAWVHRYNNIVNNANDYAFKVVRDAAGDIIVTGNTDNRTTGLDMLTIKYSGADGSVLWQRRYNGPANSDDSPGAVAVDSSGNVVVTGASWNGKNNDYYTAKYGATDGALLWEKRYNGPGNSDDQAQSVAVDGSGNVIVTGSSKNGPPNYDSDYYTATYAAADGALLWEKRCNGPANSDDRAQAVAVDGSGNVVVTGSSGNFPNADYYTAKYAASDGALLWEKRYNDAYYAIAVALDANSNVVVTGASAVGIDSFGNSIRDYYTAKYAAADGALLWEKRYNGPANSFDEAHAVAVDANGNVVVTGYSYNANFTNADYYTAKYAAADGALLWEKRYNGPANSDDVANAVAVDSSGNVVVTGSSSSGSPNYIIDYYTAKYAAKDGALLWEKHSNGGGQAVTVDGSGNVVVTGSSDSESNRSDYYTAKYAAADGALLWEQRYNGPANASDETRAVAVDASGNVVVMGVSDGRVNNFAGVVEGDYYMAKYAAADGALLWEKRYNDAYYAIAVALDANSNVVVTGGASFNGGTLRDYYTAKYAAANGALLWEQRYDGSANGNDVANAVAVDGSGNVVVTTTTRPSMRHSMAHCFGRGATTARRTAKISPARWQWTAVATWW